MRGTRNSVNPRGRGAPSSVLETMEEAGRPLDPEELLSHREWIRGLARRLVADEHTAEDVAQDALATALTRRPPTVRSLRGWLASVTRSRAIDRRRSDASRSARERRMRSSVLPSTVDLVARADAQRAVAAAVMELAEPYRTTVLLRHFEELTPTEIGERTGVPRETVKTRLRRAHALLREQLDDEFGGERDRWRAALLPLLGPTATPLPDPSPATTATATGIATGALVMSAKSKIAVVAVAALLLFAGAAGVVSSLSDESADDPAPEPADASAGVAEKDIEAPETPTEPRTLVGRVRRRYDGAPVAHVDVSVRPRGGREVHATTASDGSFALDAPAGVLGNLAVVAEGFLSESIALPAASDDLGTIWIAGGTRLLVHVEDMRGDVVEGAPVTALLWRSPGERAHVDSYLRGMSAWDEDVVETRLSRSSAHGDAVLEDVRSGSWRIVVADAEMGTHRSAFVSTYPGASEARATVVVTPLATLDGRVLDALGSPVPDVLVNAEIGAAIAAPSRTRTNADGHFSLDGLPFGDVGLRVDRRDGPGTKLAVVRIPDITSIDLTLPPTGRLVGRVADEDGAGLASEVVSIEVSGVLNTVTTATTDEQGRYEFIDVPQGRITRFRVLSDERVQLWPRIERSELVEPGRGGSTRRMAMILPGDTTTVDAVLIRGGVITGTVTGPDGTLAGVQIWRWRATSRLGQNWASTTSDDDGSFRFPPDLPGPVALEVRHPGFYQPGLDENVGRALKKGDVPGEFIVEIPESGEIARDLAVVPGGPVRGSVVDEAGVPVVDAVVVVTNTYSGALGGGVRTDAGGAFILDHVRPGKKRVISATTADETATGAVRLDVPPAGLEDPIVVRVEQREPPAEIGDSHELTGRVIVEATGRPVVGASVYLLRTQPIVIRGVRRKDQWQNDPIVAVTDDDGRFRCTLTGPGPLWVSAESAATIEGVAKVSSSFDPVEVRVRRALRLSGHVRDVDGSPLIGATVIAVPGVTRDGGGLVVYSTPSAGGAMPGRPREALTGSDGRFSVHGIPEGACKLTVFRAADVADYFGAISAKGTSFGPFDAGAEGLDLRLDDPRRASLRLHVVYPDGSPVAQGAVRWHPEGGFHGGFQNFTGGDGRIRIPDMADPSYAVRVTAYSEPRTTRVFRGISPGETEHELVLTPGETLAGRVVDDVGAPLGGLSLNARRVGGFGQLSSYSVASGEDGTFAFRDLEEGSYEIKPAGAVGGRWRRLREAVSADGGASGILVRTTVEGRLQGVVVDTHGAPVAGMRMYFHPRSTKSTWRTVPHTTSDDAGRFEMTGLDPATGWEIEPQVNPREPHKQREHRVNAAVGDRDVRIVVPAQD